MAMPCLEKATRAHSMDGRCCVCCDVQLDDSSNIPCPLVATVFSNEITFYVNVAKVGQLAHPLPLPLFGSFFLKKKNRALIFPSPSPLFPLLKFQSVDRLDAAARLGQQAQQHGRGDGQALGDAALRVQCQSKGRECSRARTHAPTHDK